jgi:HlyD family secretion protein
MAPPPPTSAPPLPHRLRGPQPPADPAGVQFPGLDLFHADPGLDTLPAWLLLPQPAADPALEDDGKTRPLTGIVRLPIGGRSVWRRSRPLPFESLAGRVITGLILAVLLLVGIGGWAAMARITSAVIAQGLRLHAWNIANRVNQRGQLEQTIEQIGEEIAGMTAQRSAMEEEIALLAHSHVKLQSLVAKGLAETPRIEAVQREQPQLRGRPGDIDASIARSRARIGEMKMRILAIEEVARTEAQRELALIETRLSELADRIAVASDRLLRTEIRAPNAGTVNELNVFILGRVITPTEVLATIVPENAKLRIKVRLSPTSIDQVRIGQPAWVRFTAFNHRTTPEVKGQIVQVSPATTQDKATGEPDYTGYADLLPSEVEKPGTLSLVPGMPTEIYLAKEEQTALACMAKTVMDQFQRALREQ